MTLRDFMRGRLGAQIKCGVRGQVVRRIAVNGEIADIDAITETVGVPLDTVLQYQSWTFDRGSIIFDLEGRGILKLCTEFDVISYDDDGSWEEVPCPS